MVAAVALPAGPAEARHSPRFKAEVRGRVVAVDRFAQTFHVRAHDDLTDPRLVLILVDHRTEFEFKRRRHDDDEDGRRGLRLLRVGDDVEVDGRLIGRRTILARDVEVFRRRFEPPSSVVIVPAPVIIFPRHSAFVTGPQFVLTGRAVRKARVFVQVVIALGAAPVRTLAFDGVADHEGLFSIPVQAGFAHPGTEHRITVWSVVDGAQSTAAGLVVYQR
jgi:hypothetical protein